MIHTIKIQNLNLKEQQLFAKQYFLNGLENVNLTL